MKWPLVLFLLLPILLFLASCARQVDTLAEQKPGNESVGNQEIEEQPEVVEQPQSGNDESTDQKSLEEEAADESGGTDDDQFTETQEELTEIHTIEIPDSWKRLGKNEIWVDFQAKQVIIGGYVCLERGLLEMFVCPMGTKEHESVIAALAPAVEMHAALLAVGAEPGRPSSWDEETGFASPTGSKIDIQVRWMDEQTQQIVTRDSRQMIQNTHTGKAMKNDWIFAGSQTYEDPETGQKYYFANSGEMICVSNFPSAAIDISMESSSDNESLLFQVYHENVPPLGTKVYLILTPGEFVGDRDSEQSEK